MIFSRSKEIEIEDLRVGRIRITVRENVIDRVAGVISPEWKLRRLRARAALEGAPRGGVGRSVISGGLKIPKKEYFGHW